MTPRILTSTIAALLLAPALHAADRFWVDPLGGPFSSTGNWSATNGGASGASVPGAADVAYFLLDETFTVTFAGAVTNADLDVSDGNVAFDLNGNTYTLTGASGFSIGRIGGETGRLTVRDGVVTTDNDGESAIVGLDAGSIGFLTVTAGGRIGNGGIRPSVVAGFSGTGTLTVNDNGRIDGSGFTAGLGVGSVGTATITGPSAVVNLTNQTNIGSDGTGTLNVTGGGTLANGAAAVIGGSASGNGTATVSGLGSLWTIGTTMDIGLQGEGTLTISSGGRVAAVSTVTLGDSATGFGTATVTGASSRWELTSTQVIGGSGLGVLTVSSGGAIVSASSGLIGSLAGSEGRVTVTGAGSQWSLAAQLTVGSSGSGELTISAGGEVSTPQVTLGSLASGSGLATVTGTGSRLVSAGQFIVASNGPGTLRVASGGEVEVGTSLSVNDPAGGAVGTLDFDGGLIATGSFTRAAGSIFNWSDGTLRLTNGTYNNASANLTINGAEAGDLPTLHLAGSSSGTGFGATTLTVGSNRAGALQVTGTSALGVTNLFLGSLDGGSGAVTVSGNGASLTSSSTLAVGGVLGSGGGAGVLNIGGGALVTTNALQLWAGGAVQISGGELRLATFASAAGAFDFAAGTVHFTTGQAGNLGPTFDVLLGFEHRLAAGRTLLFDGAFDFGNMSLIVDGGSLGTSGNALTVGANSILEMRAGAAAAGTLTTNAAGTLLLKGGQLSLTTTLTNAGEIRLETSGNTSVLAGTTLTNTGLIQGHGRIGMALTNNSAGLVRAEEGDRLILNGAATNNGTGRIAVSADSEVQFLSTLANSATIDVIGGALTVEGAATNAASSGRITARNAILRFNGGLANNGSLALSFGTSDVFGDITNSATGRIVVSGNSDATFYDDLVNNGAVQVSLGSTAVYFGAVSGTGSFPGAGTNFFEGDLSPGASPANVEFGGDLVLGSAASLTLEIGGLAAGAEYDHLDIGGTLHADGLLEVALLDGFAPQPGDSFDLFDAGAVTGSFDAVALPALAGDLEWDATNLQSAGQLRVVPEPSAALLALTGAVLLGMRRQRGAHFANTFPADPIL